SAIQVTDSDSNVIGSTSISVEAATAITSAVLTGGPNAVSTVAPGGDGAFTVAANALVEITYAPVDGSGTPLLFSQQGLSATFSNPSIIGPASSTATLPSASLFGTNNVVFLSAGTAGDASINLSAGANVNGNATVQSALNFHVTQ